MKHVFLYLSSSFEGLEWVRKVEYTCFMFFGLLYPFFLLLLAAVVYHRKFGPSGAIATPVSGQSIHLMCNRYMLLRIINKTSMFSNWRFFSCFFLLLLHPDQLWTQRMCWLKYFGMNFSRHIRHSLWTRSVFLAQLRSCSCLYLCSLKTFP